MRPNIILETIVLTLLVAHVGSLIGLLYSPRGLNILLALNALCASAILLYLASRAPYAIAAKDWLKLGLFVGETAVLLSAIAAYRDQRFAIIASYVGFGLHAVASLAAVIFAFTFKITKLM